MLKRPSNFRNDPRCRTARDRLLGAVFPPALGQRFLARAFCSLVAWMIGLSVIGLLPFGSPSLQSAQTSIREEEVKAVYIFHFGSLTEWPSNQAPEPNQPFVIGVMGNSSVAAELEKRAKGLKIANHPVVIRRLTPSSDFDDCKIVFIGRDQEYASILPKIKEIGVLIVGEHKNFAREGGMVNLVIVENTVQYEVNPDKAAEAELKFNAKLLETARKRNQIISTDQRKPRR